MIHTQNFARVLRVYILSSKRGASLIEVVMSAAILSIVVLGSNLQLVSQITSEASLNLMNQNRNLMSQMINTVQNSIYQFPLVVSGTNSSPITYVGCFTNTRLMAANALNNLSSFVGVFLNGNLTNPANSSGTLVCNTAVATFEVHVTRDPTTSGLIKINSMVLNVPGMPVQVKNNLITANLSLF